MVPVNWWTGKAKLDFEKLKGHGQTAEDPLLVDFRKCSITYFQQSCIMPLTHAAWLCDSLSGNAHMCLTSASSHLQTCAISGML